MPTALAHRGPNTLRLAKRFFWKECRRIGVLAALMFVFATLTMLLVSSTGSPRLDIDGSLVVIAVGAGMMLAVAAAATLFSVEKEEGTAELLERLPRNVTAMTIGKLGATITIVPLCTLVLFLIALAIAGDTFDSHQISDAVPRVSLFLFEAFVWSLVASLICPNPLIAAVLGIMLASVSVQLGIVASNPHSRGLNVLDANASGRLFLVGLGVLIAGALVLRWPAPLWRRGAAAANSDTSLSRKRLRWPSLQLGLFGRLVWQTIRESWVTGVVATLLGIGLTFMSIAIPESLLPHNRAVHFFTGFGLLFAPALLGAVIFRADQRRNAYRFLAEHAGRPRLLWLARNTAGLALLSLFALLLTTVLVGLWWWWAEEHFIYFDFDMVPNVSAGVESLRQFREIGFVQQRVFLAIMAALTAYAFGQFCSLVVRSDVIAGMLAMIASIVIFGWAAVVNAWVLSPSTFLLPLAIGALLASLLRVRDWMFDRRALWRWAAPIAALIAPLAWIAWAAPMVRLAQVDKPLRHVQTEDGKYSRFEELVNQTQEELQKGKEVAEAYAQLEAEEVAYEEIEVESEEHEEDWLSGSDFRGFTEPVARPAKGRLEGEALQDFLRLSRIKCRLPLDYSHGSRGVGLQAIALMDSPDAEDPIGLDEQLERLLAGRRVDFQQVNSFLNYHVPRVAYYAADEIVEWATKEGQTTKRILRAIKGLREAEAILVGPIGLLMNDYLQDKAIINDGTGPQFLYSNDPNPRIDRVLAYLANESLDFERERALKALDLLASYDAAYLGEGMRALMSGKPAQRWLTRNADDTTLVTALPYDAQRRVGRYMDDLDSLASARSSGLVAEVFNNRGYLSRSLSNWVAGVAWRRAELVRLALVAYRLKHDEYPESLEALVGDFLSEEEIRDPYSGEPFGWEPVGFNLPAVDNVSKGGDGIEPIAAYTPVLWSGGIHSARPESDFAQQYRSGVLLVYDASHWQANFNPGDMTGPRVPAMYLKTAEPSIADGGEFWLPVPK